MNVLEKKYTIELTENELHILQTAMCGSRQSLSEKIIAAEDSNENQPCKSDLQVEMRKRYRDRLKCKRIVCERLLDSLFDAEKRNEHND